MGGWVSNSCFLVSYWERTSHRPVGTHHGARPAEADGEALRQALVLNHPGLLADGLTDLAVVTPSVPGRTYATKTAQLVDSNKAARLFARDGGRRNATTPASSTNLCVERAGALL